MANTTFTISIPEADVARVVKALSVQGGREPSAANAKLALREWVIGLVVREARAEAVVTPPELT